MEKAKNKLRTPREGLDTERLLENYYSQLLRWGAVLTRGDAGMAREIVHDLCLHFTLAKPDLSQVINLDGYLYTCLRNIYLSAMARASREATQFINVAEYDSIQLVLNASPSDSLLQKQNDLRRICTFAVWRKQTSKSASYLILLFFHGYCRREVAEIACLPIAAIYNKLKIARDEVKSYLKNSGRLRIVTQEVPPDPPVRFVPVSAVELFSEFRETILQADPGDCPPAEKLLNHYRTVNAPPLTCSLLSHIVSCERCLTLIDRHFQRPTLEDREPPQDFASRTELEPKDASALALSYRAMMRSVHRQTQRIYEHRPRTISIAVDGKITAFHDVQGACSSLSSRLDYTQNAQFVEVFTDQQVRLALLPIGDRPPEGPDVYAQRVFLSDDRWLELTISFDGLGVQSEAIYFDPALALVVAEDDAGKALTASANPQAHSATAGRSVKRRSPLEKLVKLLGEWMSPAALGGAVVLVCMSLTALFAYRYYRTPLNARDLLYQSARMETADLHGQAAHQILRFEDTQTDGHAQYTGTIDVWKEGDNGRYIRRLYNDQHRIISVVWRAKDGTTGSYDFTGDSRSSAEDRAMAESKDWTQDLSASSFRNLASSEVQIHSVGENYELTTSSVRSGQVHLVSATLVLDHMLRPVREILRVRDNSTTHELRFMQTNYERKPALSVPDSVFTPTEIRPPAAGDNGRRTPALGQNRVPIVPDAPLIETEIAALFQLSKLGADTDEPIDVTRTSDRHISVSGRVADDHRRQQISLALTSLPHPQLLRIRLVSQQDLQIQVPRLHSNSPATTNIYDFAQTDPPAAATLREYFASSGVAGGQIDSAVVQFSRDALRHTQRALQHAYALDRLGNTFTPAELTLVSKDSERQWADMVLRHASGLQTELRGISEQLIKIAPAGNHSDEADASNIRVNDPLAFSRVAGQLLRQIQILNHDTGILFAARPAGRTVPPSDALIVDAMHAIPLRRAIDMANFASRLADSPNTANSLDQPASRR